MLSNDRFRPEADTPETQKNTAKRAQPISKSVFLPDSVGSMDISPSRSRLSPLIAALVEQKIEAICTRKQSKHLIEWDVRQEERGRCLIELLLGSSHYVRAQRHGR